MPAPCFLGRMAAILLGATVIATFANRAAGACNGDDDCLIGERSYRIALPEGHDGAAPRGAIIFVHGYRGTAAKVMRNKALTALASEFGVAFVAAQAAGIEWNLPGVPSLDAQEGIDELAYFDALAEDLAANFGIDPGHVMVTGFSSGAMMVWHLACHRGEAFAGFAPMSGTFWEPIPRTCPSRNVNLIHYHGREDPVVPLQGRQIKDAHQGDVFQAVKLVERIGDYRPVEIEQPSDLDCARQRNVRGNLLELCLFTGKHQMKVKHITRAWRIFASLRPQ